MGVNKPALAAGTAASVSSGAEEDSVVAVPVAVPDSLPLLSVVPVDSASVSVSVSVVPVTVVVSVSDTTVVLSSVSVVVVVVVNADDTSLVPEMMMMELREDVSTVDRPFVTVLSSLLLRGVVPESPP